MRLHLVFTRSLSLGLSLAALAPAVPAFAQHEGHADHDSAAAPVDSVDGRDPHSAHVAAFPHILGEPLGSGTAWLPGGTDPHEHAVHFALGGWTVMAHGEVTTRYNTVNFNNPSRWSRDSTRGAGLSAHPDLERGGRMIDAPNWAMIAAQRALPGGGTLMLRGMFSLDPLMVGREGYPLLYQSGEGLVDRQHPHDLFMELGALYAHPVGPRQTVFAYAGLPGEPALGPTAFMHRASAGANPDAPLGHHFQDATHITHGVLTAGYIFHRTKLDASLFHGREPDADRWGLDAGALDSWSVRATQNLGGWSLQGSYARIDAPEPGSDDAVSRATASVTRRRVFRPHAPLVHTSTMAWGMNAGHHGPAAHSLLGESSFGGRRAQSWSRYEVLQRHGTELDLAGADADRQSWVYALTLGAGGTVYTVAGTDLYLGAQGTINLHDPALEPYYGKFPLSAQVFLKIRPASLFAAKNAASDAANAAAHSP